MKACHAAWFYCLFSVPVLAADSDELPLDFSFIENAPGVLVDVAGTRLHVDCQGEGDITVLFEPGLGGSAFEWMPIQAELTSRAQTCIYDRAGYGWSDTSALPRDAARLALEADLLLSALDVDGPLLLVGHSFGGFVVRLLAQRRSEQMIGLVLVDASHEDQLVRLEALTGTSMMPNGNNFVVSAIEIPDALPSSIRRKIQAFSRMRKTYAALRAEMSQFRRSTDQVRLLRQRVEYPVTVIRRGLDLHVGDTDGKEKTAIWNDLQSDLALLASDGEMVVAQRSGHHVHTDQPDLVVTSLLSLLDKYEQSQQPLK